MHKKNAIQKWYSYFNTHQKEEKKVAYIQNEVAEVT